ncbi:MAG: hypothetical protein KDC98_21860 [Planctomycetes bacterium]|nr:hypothetical protein [Planctomycetota bacterium]
MAALREPRRPARRTAARLRLAREATLKTAIRNWLALVTLALLPLVWLWPCVLGDNTFVPFDPAAFPPASLLLTADQLDAARTAANYDVTEVWPWLLPEMKLIQDEIAAGRFPSWNPHARTGSTLHEICVHGLFYPPNWLWMFGGDAKTKLIWLTWISFALAGVFTFGLLRKVGLSPLAAWFGAATFQLSGPMLTNAYFWMRTSALVWLPALLLALLHFSEGERMRRAPLAAVAICIAMPWYAGFPPYATAGTLLGLLLMARLVLERLGRDGSAAARRLVLRFCFATTIGVLLSMPQVLPSLWFFGSEGARSAAPSAALAAGAQFGPYGLIGYLAPDAFGHPHGVDDLPANLNPLCYLWGSRTNAAGAAVPPNYNYTEYSVFLGTIGLLLAGFGAIRGRGHMRWFLLMTLPLLFGLALFVPVLNLAYRLPVICNVAPMRWLAPATLLLGWLAAIGFDRLQLVERRSLVRLAAITLALATITAVAATRPAAWHAADADWPARPIAERFGIPLADAHGYFHQGAAAGIDRFAIAAEQFAAAGWQAALWLTVCGVALGAFAMLHGTKARPWLLASLPLLGILQLGLHGAPLLAGHRLAHGTDTAVHAFLRERAQADAASGGFMIARGGIREEIPSQLPPGQLMVPGIRDLQFYTHYDARSIEPLRRVLGAEWSVRNAGRGYLQAVLPDALLEHPLFDLLGVRYVLSTEPLPHAGRRVGPELKTARGQFFVYERPHAMPRAFTVPTLRAFASDEELLTAMADPTTRYDRAALVGPEVELPTRAIAGDAPARTVTFVRDDPSVVELDIAAGAAPYLVVTDTFFPGWTASIDGESVAIARCNHSSRLLPLPDRACRVRFRHSPPLLWPGFALFAVAILAALFGRRISSTTA